MYMLLDHVNEYAVLLLYRRISVYSITQSSTSRIVIFGYGCPEESRLTVRNNEGISVGANNVWPIYLFYSETVEVTTIRRFKYIPREVYK